MAIVTIKIHPAIGIARVGNSPKDFFIGPELAGDRRPPEGGYKDAKCRVKRQAARFRLFGYDVNGKPVGEITKDNASLTWTVRLANRKAAWKRFNGPNEDEPYRNPDIPRDSLTIDPGPRSIAGPNQSATFDTGRFLGRVVPLGEIRTDADGRLLVLGGFGNSGSVPSGAPIFDYANNDKWHDDVSDGPVTATVTFNGSTKPIRALGAWVICAPPDFVPAIDTTSTLYDVLLQVAFEKFNLDLPSEPSFTKEIYPILKRTIDLRWVSEFAGPIHSVLEDVIPPPGDESTRSYIFNRLRDPGGGGEGDMPRLWSDTRHANQTLTRIQYIALKKWVAGDFVNDWTGPPAPETEITPAGLDRVALEACAGGAFYPGIEAGWFLRDKYDYVEPFRLSHTGLEAGDVTKQMAVPWQADFYECRLEGGLAWWPAQRPDDVIPIGGDSLVPWTRDLVNSKEDMVGHWHRLGFVVKRGDGCVEIERC